LQRGDAARHGGVVHLQLPRRRRQRGLAPEFEKKADIVPVGHRGARFPSVQKSPEAWHFYRLPGIYAEANLLPARMPAVVPQLWTSSGGRHMIRRPADKQ